MKLESNQRKKVNVEGLEHSPLIYTNLTNDNLTAFFKYSTEHDFKFEAIKEYLDEKGLLETANESLNVNPDSPESVIDWAFFPILSQEDITPTDEDSILTTAEYFEIILYHNLIPEYRDKILDFYINNIF